MWWYIAGIVTVLIIQMFIGFITAPLMEDDEFIEKRKEGKGNNEEC